jgi:hypothetical protein
MVRFEFKSGIVSFCFFFIFVSLGESCLLVSWCAGGRCDMAYNNEDRGRSRIPSAEDRDGRTGWVLGSRAIERLGIVVRGLHRTRGDKKHVFFD